MKVGFTGTHFGMTDKQLSAISDWFIAHGDEVTELHHGDCIGADEEMHNWLEGSRIRRVIHPPLNKSRQAFCKGDDYWPAKDYIIRNHDIVNATDILIATPHGEKEELRSGTWATIRYAKRINKPWIIFWPNGRRKS